MALTSTRAFSGSVGMTLDGGEGEGRRDSTVCASSVHSGQGESTTESSKLADCVSVCPGCRRTNGTVSTQFYVVFQSALNGEFSYTKTVKKILVA